MASAEKKQRSKPKNAGGRPPKYAEPSRPITVTLPERVLQGLQKIDPDRGKAIVKLADQRLTSEETDNPQVAIVEMAPNAGLLIVGPSEALRRIPFLHLVEVAPARYLLALEPGNDFKALEIAVHDALEEVSKSDAYESALLGKVLAHIRDLRRSKTVRMAEILIVALNGKQTA